MFMDTSLDTLEDSIESRLFPRTIKGTNNKVFSSIDVNPKKTFKLRGRRLQPYFLLRVDDVLRIDPGKNMIIIHDKGSKARWRIVFTGKNSFIIRKIASIYKLFKRYQNSGRKFSQLKNHLCTQNAKFKDVLSSMQCN
ncbi:hypothetical protein IGI04_015487 [Brassica rapa subsp. trilocularis]|uniref:TF-B3 domain-containing protein n=1 Tax=Brassica rapa subsp. trilocularis TaxID=1813537 RepID=A0ABQ7MQQ2_BRACM|nr:hypothetical protein IGI04_015487 [Brassica rapa subsp. trilocularis]